MKEVEDMMNIGPAMKRHLSSVGVYTKKELANIGPSVVYQKMKDKGLNVCKMTLYAMEGALISKNAIEIARIMKQQ
ncbi:MAG: TfoX/Sxy family protein [Candidatus Pacebacteria bacterium]|nr:TfoX/Sxy family protein [Candidatus Paceibacterota bacterium]